MSRRSPAELQLYEPELPRYAGQVSELVQLPWFAPDDEGEPVLPRAFEDGIVALNQRVPLYHLGLMALGTEIRQGSAPRSVFEFAPDDYATVRQNQHGRVSAVRSGLMLLMPSLVTPGVRAVQTAIENHQLNAVPFTMEPSVKREHEVLPAWEIPIHYVPRIIRMTSGSALTALRTRRGPDSPPPKRSLPGYSHRQEVCISWEELRRLAQTRQLTPRFARLMEADPQFWDKLLLSADDSRPGRDERLGFSRQVQLQILPPEKLTNVPELQGRLPRIQEPGRARPYQVSRGTLDSMMGGGYAYIGQLVEELDLEFTLQRHARNIPGYGFYLTLEDAGTIWDRYQRIPPATEADILVLDAAREVGFTAKDSLMASLIGPERDQVVIMRTQGPKNKNRPLPHMPRVLAAIAQERLRRPLPLPPHLVPVQMLPKLVAGSYNSNMHRLDALDHVVRTSLRPDYSTKPQVLIDWQTVIRLQGEGERAVPGSPNLILSQLPPGPHDTDPERVANARRVQTWLLGSNAMRQALQERPMSIVPPDLPAGRQLTIVSAEPNTRPPLPLVAYARRYGVSAETMRQALEQAGLDVREVPGSPAKTDQHPGARPVQEVLLAGTEAEMERYISALPLPSPRWFRQRQIAAMFFGMGLDELGISIADLAANRPDLLSNRVAKADELLTQQHIAVEALVEPARRIIMERLANDPATTVTLAQLAVMGNTTPRDLEARLRASSVRVAPRTPLDGYDLYRALQLLGISIPNSFAEAVSRRS